MAPEIQQEISLNEIRNEWIKTSGPFQLKTIAEHYNIFSDLFGEAYFVPRVPLRIHYDQADGKALPVYCGNQIKPAEVSCSLFVFCLFLFNSLLTGNQSTSCCI